MKNLFGMLLHNIVFFFSNTSRLSCFLTSIVDQVLTALCRSRTLAKWLGALILWVVALLFRISAILYPDFKKRVGEKDLTAQIKTRNGALGRSITFKSGKVRSRAGVHPNPDVTITYQNAALSVKLLIPWRDQLEQINAMKNFQIGIQGPDELNRWFTETLSMMLTAGAVYGTVLGKGVKRYTSNTNGGPVFVYVKDDKIIRITPIEFDDEDAPPWTIEARGKRFTPPRKTTASPHTLTWKSMVYSEDRLLYPMKRVDFDPQGERNLKNRGVSGYERISWDEALDIVAGEIKRVKRDYGPGAILTSSGRLPRCASIAPWPDSMLRWAAIA